MSRLVVIPAVLLLLALSCATQRDETAERSGFTDEPQAHALYDRMFQTALNAGTMYFRSEYQCDLGTLKLLSTYQVWMKKPNYARVEIESPDMNGKGILVGDGRYFWLYWTDGRPFFYGEDAEHYERTRFNSYMRKPAPPGEHSLAHRIPDLGDVAMTPFEPSSFYGYQEGLDMFLDGVRMVGKETIGEEKCNVIEAQFMDGQRSRFFWLSERDFMPRKIREIVRLEQDVITEEVWTDVRLDEDMPLELFLWEPPEGWVRVEQPQGEAGLIAPGTEAPNFECELVDGGKCRLSDFRGDVVLLVFYRAGCQACRWELRYLEDLYRKYRDRGFVVLSFDYADRRDIVRAYLDEIKVTFPSIADASEAGKQVYFEKYQEPGGAMVPLNYLIGADGRVISAWYGFEPDWKFEDLEQKILGLVSLE
jgi:peroxiredoxin/outer membrane lipoprotein-sorting protein